MRRFDEYIFTDLAAESGRIAPEEADRMITPELFLEGLNRRKCVVLSLMEQHRTGLAIHHRYSVLARSVSSYNNQFPMLVKDLQTW